MGLPSIRVLLGAAACVKLNLFEDAITWCDEGLAVSFLSLKLIRMFS